MAVVCEKFDSLGACGKPVRLGIMGGTFDPVHVGHLACAEQAREAFGLDAVVFMVAGDPAFKTHRKLASARHRVRMCRMAVADNPWFDVSTLEVERAGVTYSIDTLRALRAHYPANVELFFITGADAMASVVAWRESDELARLARFIAVSRPGCVLPPELRDDVARRGFAVEYLEGASLDVSSSMVRRRAAAGESVRYLVPCCVADYLVEHGLYVADGASAQVGEGAAGGGAGGAAAGAGDIDRSDALSDEFFTARRAELAQRVSAKRLAHVDGVTDTAARLARAYGVDERHARLAGLLHDWDKAYDNEGIRARVREVGAQVDPWVYEHMPQVLHGPTAAAALAREFPSLPADVIQAIDRHTTGALGMTPLDMVVYVADALEPGRRLYGSNARLENLRALAGKAPLEELFVRTYALWTQLILESCRQLHPQTVEVWNHYAQRLAANGEG